VHDGGLANVLVYVGDGIGKQDFPIPEEPVELVQSQCMFKPRVSGVMVGQELTLRNSDSTLHNQHARPTVNRGFNLALPSPGMRNTKHFDHEEIVIPISCAIHGWERAYVGVFSHPYFAVTDREGRFSINDLPPGTYTISTWHEKLGTLKQSITVGSKDATEISFTYESSE
jgi:hypothetical protein